MMLLWLVILFIIIYFLYTQYAAKSPGAFFPPSRETPLDILQRRYAKGEISREEFLSMKKDLES